MSYALIALHGKTFGVSDLPTSFVNTPILCTHADVRLYNAIQGRYSVEDAMQAMPHKTILPFTQRHLSMIKYLLGYDTLGNIITLCDAVRPCTFSALSLRHAVKATPTVIECSFVSFLYDYESMFGDRCGRHGEDADARLAYIAKMLIQRTDKDKGASKRAAIEAMCIEHLRVYGFVHTAHITAHFGISTSYVYQCTRRAKQALQLKPDLQLQQSDTAQVVSLPQSGAPDDYNEFLWDDDDMYESDEGSS